MTRRHLLALLTALVPALGVFAFMVAFAAYALALRFDLGANVLEGSMYAASELRARILWGSSAAAWALAMVISSVVSAAIIRSNIVSLSRTARRAVWTAIAALVAAMMATFMTRGGMARPVMRTLFDLVEKYTRVPLNDLWTVSDVLACVSSSLLVASCCSLLYFDPDNRSDRGRILARKMDQGQLSLYVAGALLVLTALQFHFLYTWPASFLPDPQRERILTVSNGLTLGAGAMFTVFLILIYVPVTVVHHWHVRELAAAASAEEDKFDEGEWLRRRGLYTSTADLLKGAAALVAPLLTASLSKILP